MKNIKKDKLIEILKNPNLESQVKHFYLHAYIKNHEEVSFSEGIINWNPEVWGLMPRDKRDIYSLVSYKGNMRYIFMSKMNVNSDGYLYFTNSVQNFAPNSIHIESINDEFISLIEELI